MSSYSSVRAPKSKLKMDDMATRCRRHYGQVTRDLQATAQEAAIGTPCRWHLVIDKGPRGPVADQVPRLTAQGYLESRDHSTSKVRVATVGKQQLGENEAASFATQNHQYLASKSCSYNEDHFSRDPDVWPAFDV